MKKGISLLMALVLCFGMATAVFADEKKRSIDEYTWAEARDLILDNGLEGAVYTVKEANLTLWLLEGIGRIEIPQEYREQGLVGYFTDAEGIFVLQVNILDRETTLEEFAAEAEKHGMKDILQDTVNGMDFLFYTDPTVKDTICRVATCVLEDGKLLEFAIYTGKDYTLLRETVFASIRPKK